MPHPHFSERIVAAIDRGKILGVRAGSKPHRVVGVWVVVVNGRVFVRSWGVNPGGWYRTWRAHPAGAITLPGRVRPIPVRAVPVRSERMKGAVSDAYARKYNTPGSLKYVRDFAREPCRGATLELVPARTAAAARPSTKPRRRSSK